MTFSGIHIIIPYFERNKASTILSKPPLAFQIYWEDVEIGLFRSQKLDKKFLLIVLIVLLAAFLRFTNIGWSYSNNGIDEGIMLERSLLIAQGFELYSDLPADQAPLWLFFGAILSGDIVSSRILNAAFSLIAIIACMEISRRLAGNRGMLLTGLILAVDFAFVRESRLFSLDGAASCFLAISLLALVLSMKLNNKLLMIAGGFTLGLSTLSKLHGGVALIGILVFFFLERYRRANHNKWALTNIGFLLISFAIPIAIALLILGPREMLDGIVLNQMHRSLDLYLKLSIVAYFAVNAAYIIPIFRLRYLWKMSPEVRLILCIALSLIAYFILQPLVFFHNLVLISPPLAVLAGVAFSDLFRKGQKSNEKEKTINAPISIRANPIIAFAVAGILISGSFAAYGILTQGKPSQVVYSEKLELMTEDGEFVISGDPLIAAYADRPIPPNVVNVAYRIHPQITVDDIHSAITEYNVSVVIVCYRLNEMDELNSILQSEGFVPISQDYIGSGEPGTLDLFQDPIEPTTFYVKESLAEELELPVEPYNL